MKKEDKQLTFWIVGFILVCYCEGLVQGTGSSVHLNDNGGIRIEEEKRLKRDSGNVQFECVKPKNIYIPSVWAVAVGPCVDHCWKVRKDWALLMQRDRCSCINNNEYTLVQKSLCNKGCRDEKKQICGGLREWSKYKTGYIEEPTFNKASNLDDLYIGCFYLREELERQPKLITERMHVRMCLEFCEYHKSSFAALHNGNVCHCSRATFRSFDSTLRCLQPCSGQMALRCGGRDKNIYALYKTEYSPMNEKTTDTRFEDMSWTKSARKPAEEYFFDEKEETKTDVSINDLSKKLKAIENVVQKKMKGKTKKNKDKRKKNKRKMNKNKGKYNTKKNKGRHGKWKGIKKAKVKKGKKNRRKKNRRKKNRKNRRGSW